MEVSVKGRVGLADHTKPASSKPKAEPTAKKAATKAARAKKKD